MKYVSDSNLSRFFQKLKGIFAKKSEVPSQADLDARYLQLSGGTMTGTFKAENLMAKDTVGIKLVTAEGHPGVKVANTTIEFGTRERTVGTRFYTTGGGIDIQRNMQVYDILDSSNTAANPALAGTEAALTSIKIDGTSYKNQPASVQYLTTAPTADNTDGIKIVVLSAEPSTYYNGFLYLIQGS